MHTFTIQKNKSSKRPFHILGKWWGIGMVDIFLSLSKYFPDPPLDAAQDVLAIGKGFFETPLQRERVVFQRERICLVRY